MPSGDSLKTMGLYNNVDRILADLASAGLTENGHLAVADLTPFDQYHYEGADAVDQAAIALAASSATRVLDIGAGLGGPARYLANATGAHVTALELQADLDALGASLTDRCGLADQVRHVRGNILDRDIGRTLGGRSFDAMMSMLCILHIPDRDALFHNCARVMAPGGRIFIDDYYQRGALTPEEREDLATQVACPYLPTLDEYGAQIRRAGFTAIGIVDKTDDWTTFVGARLTAFRAARTELVRRYNPETVASLDHFYATVADLFRGGNLGGLRLTARLPT